MAAENSFSMYVALPNNPQQQMNSFASLMNENILQNAINKMDSTKYFIANTEVGIFLRYR